MLIKIFGGTLLLNSDWLKLCCVRGMAENSHPPGRCLSDRPVAGVSANSRHMDDDRQPFDGRQRRDLSAVRCERGDSSERITWDFDWWICWTHPRSSFENQYSCWMEGRWNQQTSRQSSLHLTDCLFPHALFNTVLLPLINVIFWRVLWNWGLGGPCAKQQNNRSSWQCDAVQSAVNKGSYVSDCLSIRPAFRESNTQSVELSLRRVRVCCRQTPACPTMQLESCLQMENIQTSVVVRRFQN